MASLLSRMTYGIQRRTRISICVKSWVSNIGYCPCQWIWGVVLLHQLYATSTQSGAQQYVILFLYTYRAKSLFLIRVQRTQSLSYHSYAHFTQDRVYFVCHRYHYFYQYIELNTTSLFHVQAVGQSFGFSSPPKVSLNLESKGSKFRKQENVKRLGAAGGGRSASGHGFSASNPYGKRPSNDKRQFSRI